MSNKLKKTPAKPPWWSDDILPVRLLHHFLDKLEKGSRPYLRVNDKKVPELYDFQGEDVDFLWALLTSLDKDYHVISIKLAKIKPQDEPYEGAKIYFMLDKESLVRQWLNRPAFDPYAITWAHELERQRHNFEDNGLLLNEYMLRVKGKSAAQVVRALAKMGEELQHNISLRTLSARCFWGDSKFLDSHEPLVKALYPSVSANLNPRPLMLAACLSPSVKQVVFVENQDTFLALTQMHLADITLVYSAGFRGSALRVREPGQGVFTYILTNHNPQAREVFEYYWFNPSAPDQPRYWFWGDLDYAGMSILKSLRQSFESIGAWPLGYNPLLQRLENNQGHTQISGVKNKQFDPGFTGCRYADTVLLPAIREQQSFLDQEALFVGDIF